LKRSPKSLPRSRVQDAEPADAHEAAAPAVVRVDALEPARGRREAEPEFVAEVPVQQPVDAAAQPVAKKMKRAAVTLPRRRATPR
jgi:hypothetical protein